MLVFRSVLCGLVFLFMFQGILGVFVTSKGTIFPYSVIVGTLVAIFYPEVEFFFIREW